MKNKVYLSLGSNIGNRQEYIESAIELVGKTEGIKILKKSGLYETSPVGYVEQDLFLNAVIKIETDFSAREILKIINKIENELDRKREIRWGPRTIDIDILIFSDKKINETDLIIPHKEMLNRLFVLVPLIEIYDGEYFEKEKIIERIEELVAVGNQKIEKL
ncbi:2-amino-4-hydroxy-6-hydroxymethyldihydropteridine diphosphokinase [Leptotrichia buccalis]|uniref:2-amino-4-hydroxy-6-hydroxymethyldihydropteridine diphosphokinase n=1 Tax=Leptotrichia buccalis (strain ATCC 14201 / DSM 1135 / JCM 12969 / NCTC 10249 / C-1013-b) TaxID=523794 RepID=C7NAF8_LEPBD|nr:2-amino-4-hydroxy-6-hydroxymethyldihydropteridine diphosphokinase [Leptotrichia buccalis]ACV39139.1 2-amino-4-hydroxy-6-hydroxymethyldihydropteridin epyrophosphokinase [Leptotrichia buccalis C-1013-b]